MKTEIEIYDTTLRDGEQAFDVDFSVDDKLALVDLLDSFGVDYIEIGWPRPGSADMELAEKLDQSKLKHSKLAVFGSTRKIRNNVEDDAILNALVYAGETSGAETATIFGKTWKQHVEHQLKATPEENLKAIYDSIKYLKTNDKRPFPEVIYDAEHFFDGYKDDSDYAKKTLRSAILGKADKVVLCDSNGGCLHFEIGEITKDVNDFIDNDEDIQRYLNGRTICIGVHCHNDCGVGTAGTIEGLKNGATHVQGTINGLGERIGNTDLCTIIPAILLKNHLKEKYRLNDALSNNLKDLTELSSTVSKVAGVEENPSLPYVGRKAFTHDGGVHVDALIKGAEYNHIKPSSVGNKIRVNLSSNSGKAAALYVLKKLGFVEEGKEDDPRVMEFLGRVHKYSSEGFNIGLLKDEQYYLARDVFGTKSVEMNIERCDLYTNYRNSGNKKHDEVCLMDMMVNGKTAEMVGRGKYGQVGVGFDVMKKAVSALGHNSDLILVDYNVSLPKGDCGAESLIQATICYKTPKGKKITTSALDSNIIVASMEAGKKALTLFAEGYKN